VKFLIRADASFETGTGHVMRCIALGQMLSDAGHQVIYLTQTDNQMIQERILREGFGINIFKEGDILKDAVYTANAGKDIKADWIITDGYKFKTEYQKIIKNAGFKLMCIDDICECHYVSDIVLNQNINAERLYRYSCEHNTRLLLGIDFVLLRREFRKSIKWERKIEPDCKNILITLGGSDPKNITPQILKVMELAKIDKINLRVIAGANSENIEEIRDISKDSKHNIECFINIANIEDQMKWCDLAISAAGSTVWELMMYKTPMVLFVSAGNQENISNQLKSLISVETIDNIKRLNSELNRFLSYEYRKSISDKIYNYLKKSNFASTDIMCHIEQLKIRKAAIEDISIIYELSNDDDVRINSIRQERIEWEEHKIWYNDIIKDKECFFYVIFDNKNNFVGQIRFNRKNNKVFISISIHKDFRGKGLSTFVLKETCRMYFNENKSENIISAYIKKNNQSSIKSFEKTGFVLSGTEIISENEYYLYSLNRFNKYYYSLIEDSK